jgi:hypothetical protein
MYLDAQGLDDLVLANWLHVLSSNAHNRVGFADVANKVLCLCLCSARACRLQRDAVFVGSTPHGVVITIKKVQHGWKAL